MAQIDRDLDVELLRSLVENHGYKWVKMTGAAISGCCSNCDQPRPPGIAHEYQRPACKVDGADDHG